MYMEGVVGVEGGRFRTSSLIEWGKKIFSFSKG